MSTISEQLTKEIQTASVNTIDKAIAGITSKLANVSLEKFDRYIKHLRYLKTQQQYAYYQKIKNGK